MKWWLIKSSWAGRPMDLMFYSDMPVATSLYSMTIEYTGSGNLFEWGSGTWQYVPAPRGFDPAHIS
jgi:hypothetical protein